MNLVILLRRQGLLKPLHLSRSVVLAVGGVAVSALMGLAFASGMWLGGQQGGGSGDPRLLRAERSELAALREQVRGRVDALSVRIGQMNAQLLRLDALGKRLTEITGIDSREFNFDDLPGVGGARTPAGADGGGVNTATPEISGMLDQIQQRLDSRDAQLLALEGAILARELDRATRPSGKPVQSGYISSHFGARQDPFSGHGASHLGVDFAGRAGSEVMAVGEGLVIEAGYHDEYGHLVEIRHGNGYVTRYAHNQRTLVKAGDRVTRGQPIALMGSTGRSTGAHVHFEVLKDGRPVNPLAYVGP
jgi:murein DD-endopeptidase MepM/ murein hydrolase activator NlpD